MRNLGRTRTGAVLAFDPERGLGEISSEEATLPFHCTEIADGTRRIDVGTAVRFVELSRFGRIEAARIETVASPAT